MKHVLTAATTGVLKLDPWLEPFKGELRSRFSKAQEWIKRIDDTEGGLEKFSRVGFGVSSDRDACADVE